MNMESYIENYLNTSETVIFETKAPITQKQNEDFSIFNFTKRNTVMITVMFVVASISVLEGITSIALGKMSYAIISLLLGGLGYAAPFIIVRTLTTRETKSAYFAQNFNDYKFYSDYFVNTDRFAVTVIPYNFILDAHENGKYFFLYISNEKAHIIPKNSFTVNTPEEMRNFLHYKLGERFINHCKQ